MLSDNPGATKLRQLDQTLERVECDVVKSVSYPDYRPQDGEYFDFIVVRAGSAGSVMANRLSENPGWRVLVLEAGRDPNITSEFPSLLGPVVSQCCLATQTDPGATKLRQLDQTLETVECDVVKSVTYPDYKPQDGEYFDFIVVGAGSAGSVMANRLSENPGWRVLVLEAGGDPNVASEFPSLMGTLVGSQLDWNYTTQPDSRSCLGSVNQRCVWPRGKVLGGTSTINSMAYNRGHPEVYNSWEREGNVGWGYDSLLPYFKKSEDLESDIVKKNANYQYYHGECGYLTVDTYYQLCDLEVFFRNISMGFKDLGYGTHSDLNAQFHEGFFNVQVTQRNGRRCSTAKAFLKPAQARNNLKISKRSLVTKILIDKEKTARGVTFEKCGTTITVRARKEVILSAGSVNSPQLLMLSGIGPRDHLNDLGIQVISDLPVGYNLQDHYATRVFYASVDINIPPQNSNESFYGVLFQSKGTYNTNGNIHTEAYITTSNSKYPNIMFYPLIYPVNSTDLGQEYKSRGYDDAFLRAVAEINAKKSILLFYPVLVKPKSTGRVLLKSRNPKDYPLIYPKYLSEEEDVNSFLEAIYFANKFVNTEALKKLGARVERLDIPVCKSFIFQSDDYWKCMIRYYGVSAYHTVGTCRMGPRGSPLAVVDPNLRVIGVSGLRVVDGSVMPTVTNGNTNAPIIAIAEKASDLVKFSWVQGG